MKTILTTVLMSGLVVGGALAADAATAGTVNTNMGTNSDLTPGGRANSRAVNTTGDILSEGGAATMPTDSKMGGAIVVSTTDVTPTTSKHKKMKH